MTTAAPNSAFSFLGAPLRGTERPQRIAHGFASKCALLPRMSAAAPPPSLPPPSVKRKSGTRTPTFRKLQRKQRAGPREFRQRLEQEKEDAAQDEAAALAAKKAKREMKRARRARRKEAIPLSELKVGAEMTGVVQNLVRHGAYVDVGAKRDGLVHVRDMSIDFVHAPQDIVREGDEVTVWVKYVDTVSNVLGLSMRPELPVAGPKARTKISDIVIGKRYEGHVARVTNYGAYVDIGAERHGFLHSSCLWGRRPRETLDELRLGRPIWVVVEDVDEIRSHIKLNARGRAHVPLDGDGKVAVEKVEEVELPDPVTQNMVLARPGEDVGEEEEMSDTEAAMMLGKERARDEHLLEKVGPVAQTASWDEIRHMFDDGTEFMGMNEEEQ